MVQEELLPQSLLKPFNFYTLRDTSTEFRSEFNRILIANNNGDFKPNGRTPEQMKICSDFGFAAEAWMVLNGAVPDVRKYRDAYILRDGILIPIDVKCKEKRHEHISTYTVPDINSKLNGDFKEEWKDLKELYVWEYDQDTGDVTFWKAIEIRDSRLED